jgi:hypothetical protein
MVGISVTENYVKLTISYWRTLSSRMRSKWFQELEIMDFLFQNLFLSWLKHVTSGALTGKTQIMVVWKSPCCLRNSLAWPWVWSVVCGKCTQNHVALAVLKGQWLQLFFVGVLFNVPVNYWDYIVFADHDAWVILTPFFKETTHKYKKCKDI